MDRAALDCLYRAHGPSVLRRARQVLRDDDDARDVVQELFLSLARGGGPEPERITTAWFYTAATHLCLNRLRNRNNRTRLWRQHGSASERTDAARGEALVLARDVLARLPAPLAEVAIYHFCDEMTHGEIAALLGCSRRHVGDLLERIHQSVQGSEACG